MSKLKKVLFEFRIYTDLCCDDYDLLDRILESINISDDRIEIASAEIIDKEED